MNGKGVKSVNLDKQKKLEKRLLKEDPSKVGIVLLKKQIKNIKAATEVIYTYLGPSLAVKVLEEALQHVKVQADLQDIPLAEVEGE